MTTEPPAPDERHVSNGQPALACAFSLPGDDPLELSLAELTAFWALVLSRFRDYLHRSGGPEHQSEEDR